MTDQTQPVSVGPCPFLDPKFEIPVDEPCPVCGMRGFDWPTISDNCVGDVPSPQVTEHE
jgi:hypothetical protein